MAVTSPAPNTYRFTADGDVLLERIRVRGFVAILGGTAGVVEVFTKVAQFNQGPTTTQLAGVSIWKSGAANANQTIETTVPALWCDGLRVAMPSGAVLIVHTSNED